MELKIVPLKKEVLKQNELDSFADLEIATKDLNGKDKITQIELQMKYIQDVVDENNLPWNERMKLMKRYEALALERGNLIKKRCSRN